LRVLGKHPADGRPVELFAGRYGPYVKHGAVNATVRDRDRVDALTLEEALALLAEKAGSAAPAKSGGKRPARKPAAPKAAEPKAGYVPVVKTGRSKLAPAKPSAGAKTTTRGRTKKSAPRAPAAPKSRAKAAKKR
jgi:DNA topoisomerase-1